MRTELRGARKMPAGFLGARLEVDQTASAADEGPSEELEDWKSSGHEVKSTLSDEELMKLSAQISTQVYHDQIHSFVDPQDSRFVAHEGNGGAAEYIKGQLLEFGMNVTQQSFEDKRVEHYVNADGKERVNILGYIPGTDLAGEAVLLGAHYDSVNWEDTTGKAPGVDDNGSGLSLLLAVAKALKGSSFRRSVVFAAFNAEEEGLVGSEHFVKAFAGEGSEGEELFGKLKAVIIADEVAWPGRGSDRRKAIFETVGREEGQSTIVDTLARCAMMANATDAPKGDGIGDGNQNFVVNYKGFGSDHIPFLDEGIPAVLLIERDDEFHADTYGHSDRDNFDHVDLDFGAAMSRLALRALVSLANPAD